MKLFNIVLLGRFLEENSVSIALQAFAKFYHGVSQKYRKKIHLTLIDKRYHHILNQDMISEFNLQECTTLLALQQQEEIEHTYKSSSLLLLPRRINSTSIIKESFLFGLPILCFENPSYINLLDASNSMTIMYRNDSQAVDEFANVLSILHFDPDAVHFLKKGAAKKFEQDLSWGKRRMTR